MRFKFKYAFKKHKIYKIIFKYFAIVTIYLLYIYKNKIDDDYINKLH